jgi:WD40 repeat protein
VQTGQAVLTLTGHDGLVRAVAFSPDGKRIATCAGDATMKVWDATTGIEAISINGQIGPLYSLAFSPDGDRIAVGGENVVKVFGAE